jgi:hypothetical protein
LPEEVLDVRPVLAQGGSPLKDVLKRWEALPLGACLRVIAPFPPAPMLALFSGRGVHAHCREIGPEEYHLLLGPKPG